MIRTSGRTAGQTPADGTAGRPRTPGEPRREGGREGRGPADLLAGVVLCGGASRRMGRDKAGLDLGDRTLLERTVAIVAGRAPRVLLACGPAARYRELGPELVLDRSPDAGPLAGLEAALARLAEGEGREGWLLVLACDMPRARGEVFDLLLERARARRADACLLATGAGLEPLYAVYHTRCLPAVRAALAAGERRMVSFHAGFGPLAVATLAAAELPPALGGEGCARNLNTPRELAEERGERP
ncbi:MAG: molybdenum cofactor guanylyltransferase [Planctomycetota bacterium]